MSKVKEKQLRRRSEIIEAVIPLKGSVPFEQLSVNEICSAAGISVGSFYHYFESKDALLGTLSTLFDEKYEALTQVMNPDSNAIDTLLWLNRELFTMVDSSVPIELLSGLLSPQLSSKGEKHLLDRSRLYFRLLREIIVKGQHLNGFLPV